MIRRIPVFLLLAMPALATAQAPLRVACVGDSITYGDKIPDRGRQSYPATLARLSGGRFATGNFGVNGATALHGTGRAWEDTAAARAALAYAPDLVVAMLGINDLAFPDRHAEYAADLRGLVRRFQALPSAPRVFLCTLTPIAPAEAQAAANQTIRDTLNPAIRAVAAETGAAVIDVSAAYPNRLELLPDGLHPSPAGAELLARTVLAALVAPTPGIQPAPVAGPVAASIRNEARAAIARAERWLEAHPPPADLPEPPALEDPAPFLALLAASPSGADGHPCAAYAALAAALDRQGEETVFLPDGRPVAWREALLHQLVQRQRIDPQGGGFWQDPAAADSAAAAARATAYALRALATTLGE